MEIADLLGIKGIYRGNATADVQFYQIVAVSRDEKHYLITIGCMKNFQESVEKAFTRITFIAPPKDLKIDSVDIVEPEKPTTEGEAANGTQPEN